MYKYIKTLLKRRELLALIVILGGFAASLVFILQSISKNPIQSSGMPLTVSAAAGDQPKPAQPAGSLNGLPVRLKIPKIKIDAAVESVGLTPQGAMGVPKNPTDAAWFNLGPLPGEAGSSVIDGHIGLWNGNQPIAVFDFLHKLHPGDKIYVVDDKGVTTTFVVSDLRTYAQNADDSNVFSSSDGKAHLNLITCDGTWNKTLNSYPDRLVVFTNQQA
jgi:LPXTG-site transpeptidase (sortase) family protein